MPKNTFSLDEAMALGQAASDYANTQILLSASSLKMNKLSKEEQAMILNSLADPFYGKPLPPSSIRTVAIEKVEDQLRYNPLEKDKTLLEFENTIEVTKKYSLGNCQEYAMQALDYILNESNKKIRAEVFEIEEGDHVILVINRKKGSLPNDPLTWGDGAVFCDPLANKVFKASDYLTKTSDHLTQLCAFERRGGKNKFIKFNPKKHKLVELAGFNTDYLGSPKKVEKLKENFDKEVKFFLKTLENYLNDLDNRMQKISRKYGNKDAKLILLQKKYAEMQTAMQVVNQVKNDVKNNISPTDNYRTTKPKLQQALKTISATTSNALRLTPKEQEVLFQLRKNSSNFGMFSQSKTKAVIEKHIKAYNTEIEKKTGKRR